MNMARPQIVVSGVASVRIVFTWFILAQSIGCGSQPITSNHSQKNAVPKSKLEPKEEIKSEVASENEADTLNKTKENAEQEQEDQQKALEESYALMLEAEILMGQGDVEAAQAVLTRISQRTPEIPEAHFNLGVIAERSNNDTVAREHYKVALQINPKFSPARLAIVRFSLRNGDSRRALSELESALKSDPDNPSLLNARARVWIDQIENIESKVAQQRDLRISKVIRDSKQVLRQDEQNIVAMTHLAAAYHLEGKFELAVEILKNAKSIEPNQPEVYARLSKSYIALDERVRARLTLEEAVKNPNGRSAEIHNQLGLIYHGAGDYPSAEQQFKEALELWPTMIEAQVNLGNALKGQQRFQEAAQAFEQALVFKVEFLPALFNLGILYLDGKFSELDKIEQLQRALDFFDRFKSHSKNANDLKLVDQYKKECTRLIDVQKKINEQQVQAAKDEEEARKAAEAERIAAEKAAEAERIVKEKEAEAERIAKEKEAEEEAERLTLEKIETEQLKQEEEDRALEEIEEKQLEEENKIDSDEASRSEFDKIESSSDSKSKDEADQKPAKQSENKKTDKSDSSQPDEEDIDVDEVEVEEIDL